MASGSRSSGVRGSWRSGAWPAAAAALLADAACSLSADADPAKEPSGQVWAGADVSSNVWLIYSGVTLAPWSSIYDDGFRFRAAGGYGGYKYAFTHHVPDVETGGAFSRRNRDATTYFGDVLVGYLKRFGELTAKAFVGASVIGHEIELGDEVVGFGDEVGVKGVVELWLNIGERGWGSLDMWWSSAHDTRAARARLGYRVWPQLSIGLEAGLNVDAEGECRITGKKSAGCGHVVISDTGMVERDLARAKLLDYGRAGAFVRYEWGWSELSVSAGVLKDTFSDKDDVAPYVTVNWLAQF